MDYKSLSTSPRWSCSIICALECVTTNSMASSILIVLLLQHLYSALGHPISDIDITQAPGRFSVPIYRSNDSDPGHLTRRITSDASSWSKFAPNMWSPISIGGQEIAVALDTGSSDLSIRSSIYQYHQLWLIYFSWLYTTKDDPKSYTNGVGGMSLYNPYTEKARSFEMLSNVNFSMGYGGGWLSFHGPVGRDQVTVGTTKAVKQSVGLVPYAGRSKDLKGSTWQGILGMPYGDTMVSCKIPRVIYSQFLPAVRDNINCQNWIIAARPKQNTWLQNIMPSLDEKLFTTTFTSDDGHGKWSFGYIDETQYSGTINYVPFNKCAASSGYWTINSLTVT